MKKLVKESLLKKFGLTWLHLIETYDPKPGQTISDWWNTLSLRDVGNVSVEIECRFSDLATKTNDVWKKLSWDELPTQYQEAIIQEYKTF